MHEGTASASAFVRRIDGRKLLFLTDQYSNAIRVYRFNAKTDGEIAIPCGLIARARIKNASWPPHQPVQGEWIWRDANGNGAFDANEYQAGDLSKSAWDWGLCIDARGGIWSLQPNGAIRYLPMQGLDPNGSPKYSYGAAQQFAAPDFVTELMRIEYVAGEDVVYLSAYTKENPHTGGEWGTLGTEVIRIDNWSRGNRAPRWRAKLPYDWSKTLFTKSMCVEGDYLFATEGRLPAIHVYHAATGTEAGVLKPGAEVGSIGGWVDMTHGI